MKTLLAPLVALLLATGVCATSVGVFYAGRADAQPAAETIDAGTRLMPDAGLEVAGSANTAGSGSAIAPSTLRPTDALHDPGTQPVEYIGDLKLARKVGWPLTILVGLWGLCRLLGHARTIPWLSWLGVGKTAFVVGSAGAFITAALDALLLGGNLVAAGVTGAIALFGYRNIGAPPSTSSSGFSSSS